MMSGNIWFESTQNKGTTFSFTVRVKVVQPHIATPTPFCLLGAMWYKNQEWPDIVAVSKRYIGCLFSHLYSHNSFVTSEHLQHVITAKLSRPQARTFSRSNVDTVAGLFDKTRKQVRYTWGLNQSDSRATSGAHDR